MAGGDQRARDHRPADRPFVVARRSARPSAASVTGTPSAAEPFLDRDDAGAAMAALLGEKRGQRRRRRIDAVAEDVDVLAVLDRRDLDAGEKPQAGRARARGRGGDAGGRVVVAQAEGGDAVTGEP